MQTLPFGDATVMMASLQNVARDVGVRISSTELLNDVELQVKGTDDAELKVPDLP